MPAATRVFRALGFIGAGATVMRARVLPPVAPKNTGSNSRVAVADGSLLFVYKGYTSEHKKALSQFVSDNYAFMVARFGLPSPEQRASGGKTIRVVGNDTALDANDPDKKFQGAYAYQPLKKADDSARGDGGTIYFPYNASAGGANSSLSQRIVEFSFTRLILRAFQGPNNFSYDFLQNRSNDVYQAGLSDAASLLVLYDSLSDAAKQSFDPSQYGFTYLLPVYDLINRPELSNAAIFSASTDPDSLLPDFRLGMAQAAWLKVAIEDPTFFQRFNAAYYAQIPARQAATSQQLRGIAAQAVNTVEGLSFQDWARRQTILDTSVTTGTKILPILVPVGTAAGTSQTTGFIAYVEAFSTDANGNDTRLTGYGSVEALDENGVNINVQSPELSASNLLNLKKTRGDGGTAPDFEAGFVNMAAPNLARISVKFNFQGAQNTALFPFVGPTSGNASQTTIYGASQNGSSGAIVISNNAGSETATLSRGAFAGTQKYLSAPAVTTSLTLGGRVFKRNTAWLPALSRGVAFVLEGSARNDAFTLKTASGASKVRMISLPIFPTQSDEAAILSIPAKDLKLARYRPNLAPATLSGGVLSFGITGDRHELYPHISAPMAPGRGYWLGSGEITRTVQGSEPRGDQPFEVELPGGWNQFGVPFNTALAPDAIQVRYGSFAPVSYADAVKNGLLAPGIWRWQGRGGYARADAAPGATLPPFEGFYLYAIPARGVSLIFHRGAASAANARAQASWSVPLAASTTNARDASNRFGVAGATSTRLAAAKPPTGPPVVTLHFASSGDGDADQSGAGAASGWADSFLASLVRQGQWDFTVEGTTKGESVALSWGDLKDVPADVKLTVRDENAKRSLALRAGGSYKWTSDGQPRRFSMGAIRAARARIKVTPAPSQGVEIAVGMTLTAHGRLEIQNLAGDTLFVIKSGDFPARTTKFGWNGQTRSGEALARGRYRALWIPTLEADHGASSEFNWRP